MDLLHRFSMPPESESEQGSAYKCIVAGGNAMNGKGIDISAHNGSVDMKKNKSGRYRFCHDPCIIREWSRRYEIQRKR